MLINLLNAHLIKIIATAIPLLFVLDILQVNNHYLYL